MTNVNLFSIAGHRKRTLGLTAVCAIASALAACDGSSGSNQITDSTVTNNDVSGSPLDSTVCADNCAGSPYLSGPITRVHDNTLGPRRIQVSGNAAYTLFDSSRRDLVPSDSNNETDVFLRDNINDSISRISVRSDGGEANNDSRSLAMSADGRYILFLSHATNLLDDVEYQEGEPKFYRYDTQTNNMREILTNNNDPELANNPGLGFMSDNGRYIAYANNTSSSIAPSGWSRSVFHHDVATGQTTQVTTNTDSFPVDMTPDGRFILYFSLESQFVSGAINLYVFDSFTNSSIRIPNRLGDEQFLDVQKASISDDGQYVTWDETVTAGDRKVFWYSNENGNVLEVGSPERSSHSPDISGNGRYVIFESPVNTIGRLYIKDMFAAEPVITELSPTTLDGFQFTHGETPRFTPDGSHIWFWSDENNLVENDDNEIADHFSMRLFQ